MVPPVIIGGELLGVAAQGLSCWWGLQGWGICWDYSTERK